MSKLWQPYPVSPTSGTYLRKNINPLTNLNLKYFIQKVNHKTITEMQFKTLGYKTVNMLPEELFNSNFTIIFKDF